MSGAPGMVKPETPWAACAPPDRVASTAKLMPRMAAWRRPVGSPDEVATARNSAARAPPAVIAAGTANHEASALRSRGPKARTSGVTASTVDITASIESTSTSRAPERACTSAISAHP
jgi:hypothetical protein